MNRPHEHALVAYELYPEWQPATVGLFYVRGKEGIRLLRITSSHTSRPICDVPGAKQVRLLLTWSERFILLRDNITSCVDYDEWLSAYKWTHDKETHNEP